ncbi:hypothetical protein CYQ88_06825 [Hydrogenovibrio sp. SC-1]|uniref:DUF2914 domain-containing protein n=1 Tax=Hydrogenovibrio sp. SC-1 TaxID=2065820 RepID=UPI000C7C8CAC|nr:DUF2914 domain-containing protein [Hydrogenovibrio sp. SC-1]PLA74226.1 hypothetical protein CYQ88_06825 [Hydrogenovibrio sp. SC-1]
MKLPETDNAHYHYAFKKGYRLALEGKPQSHMPSQIRQDREMRTYFQMGWEQLQEELKNGEEDQQRTPWRQRFAWYLMMILAGIGTASLMITQKQDAQQQQQQKIDQPQTQVEKEPGLVTSTPGITPESLSLKSHETQVATDKALVNPATESQPDVRQQQPVKPQQSLELLSDQQRQDLQLTRSQKQKQLNETQVKLSPVMSSSIKIRQAQLGQSVSNRQLVEPVETVVPKYIRKLAFFTEIENAQNTTIYHRWVYQNQTMATVALKIESPVYRTWSTKQLTSAWEGNWHIDVLDENKNVIFRHHFRYIQ